MIYITYKTVNIVDGKYYFGQHATKDINDAYLGSGIRLKAAVKKHGRFNFKREVVGIHATRAEMNAAEIALLTPAVLADPLCYNLAPGGSGSHAGGVKRPRRLTLISKAGEAFEGTVAELSATLGMPRKKVYDIAQGFREHYRGFRMAS